VLNTKGILIVTQKIDENDDVLGFMHGWIKEFAKNFEKVTVICLERGKYHLPENVKVLSLGKERFKIQDSRFKNLKYFFRFYKYIFRERANYSCVFVHMNQIYVTLGGLVWRALGKKIGLWYAHGHVPYNLRLAEMLSDFIFTSTRSGFRLKSKKVHVIGQGINTDKFNHNKEKNNLFEMIIVGRISPVKDYETLINAIEIFSKNNSNFHLSIIGSAGTEEQKKYLSEIKDLVREKNLEDKVSFRGSIPNREIATHLKKSDLFISTSNTGSLDKAMLEAMASSVLVLTCNVSMVEVLGPYKEKLMFEKGDFQELAGKVEFIAKLSENEREKMEADLKEIVKRDHNLENFVTKIISRYSI
jgi:glycosyltransferase involved in cell wall biosynthesis